MLLELAERRLAPDVAIRFGIRRRLRNRLRKELAQAPRTHAERVAEIRRQFAKGLITENNDDARRQRAQPPLELVRAMLGPRLKCSCCLGTASSRSPRRNHAGSRAPRAASLTANGSLI
jgi:cyclopropane-fatty-acyl-phospholipid synthase